MMKRGIKIASVFLLVIVVLTIGIVLYDSGKFVSTEQLQTEGFKRMSIPESQKYLASFYRNKSEVAEVSVDVGLVMPQQDLASMQFYVSHDVGMLNSLYLEFTPTNPGGFINWYLKRPAAQTWPPMIFQTSTDGLSTIVGVNDLRLIGGGTVELDFYLGPLQTNSFWFEVNFTMHATNSLLARQVGSAQIELPITFENVT